MQINVIQTTTHIEITASTSCIAQPEAFPLLELTAGTPSAPQAIAFALLDTLAIFLHETSLRRALIEVTASSRNLWLLEHIDIWNYASEKGASGTVIAYVVTASTVDREWLFAENYAGKRGIVLKFFTAKSSALRWLLTQHCPQAKGWDSSGAATFESGARKTNPVELFAN